MKTVIAFRGAYGKKTMPKVAELIPDTVAVNVHEEDIPKETDVVFRWGWSGGLSGGDFKVINPASSIVTAAVKRTARKLFADDGIAPKTYISFNEFLGGDTSGEWIVRPAEHSRSKDLHYCTTIQEVHSACDKYPVYYISKFIPKVSEFRAFCFQGRVFAMIRKLPVDPDEVSWGCTNDGEFSYVPWSEWPEEVSRVALRAIALCKLDFGAVDIIVDEHGTSFVLEVNTAPYLSIYYIKSLAKVLKYKIMKQWDTFEYPTKFDFKSVIHPAMQES